VVNTSKKIKNIIEIKKGSGLTNEYRAILHALYAGNVPKKWQKYSYPEPPHGTPHASVAGARSPPSNR